MSSIVGRGLIMNYKGIGGLNGYLRNDVTPAVVYSLAPLNELRAAGVASKFIPTLESFQIFKRQIFVMSPSIIEPDQYIYREQRSLSGLR